MGWQFPKLLYTYMCIFLLTQIVWWLLKVLFCLNGFRTVWIRVSNSMVMNVSKIGFKDVDKKQMKINKIYFVSTGAKLLDVYRIIK